MFKTFVIVGSLAGITSMTLVSAQPEFKTSLISTAGKYVPLPKAAHQPKPGSKIVFDVAGADDPAAVVKGLDRVAMFLNLVAENGAASKDSFDIAVVLHGNATAASLGDQAYAQATEGDNNPNLPLIRKLQEYGVRFYVCGQALARKGMPLDGVADEVAVAVSAITVIINEQNQGAAYVPYN